MIKWYHLTVIGAFIGGAVVSIAVTMKEAYVDECGQKNKEYFSTIEKYYWDRQMAFDSDMHECIQIDNLADAVTICMRKRGH